MMALYLNRLADDLADAEAAIRLAALTRNQRDECLGHNILGISAIEGGDFPRAESDAEARQAGFGPAALALAAAVKGAGDLAIGA